MTKKSDRQIVHKITPLHGSEALYITDHRKATFDHPIHNHDVYELNFVENAAGARRVVGDSIETIDNHDLVLITSPKLAHVWEQNDCTSEDIREITIQFLFGLKEDDFFEKSPFTSIRRMLKAARKGLCFPQSTINKVYDKLDKISTIKDSFEALMLFLEILNVLAHSEDARTLATSSYARMMAEDDSRRILKVKNYIDNNYPYNLKLQTLADMANMSPSAFCRYFKLHTGRTMSDYITDIRLGHATRLLIDTDKTIADISFKCGYNNLSNFNRTFRRKKGCSPRELRENFKKARIIV